MAHPPRPAASPAAGSQLPRTAALPPLQRRQQLPQRLDLLPVLLTARGGLLGLGGVQGVPVRAVFPMRCSHAARHNSLDLPGRHDQVALYLGPGVLDPTSSGELMRWPKTATVV